MLRRYRQVTKHFWRKSVIYLTVLTLFIQPGTLQQLMAQEHNRKQHLRLINLLPQFSFCNMNAI